MRGTSTPLKTGPFSVSIPNTAGPYNTPNTGGGNVANNLMQWQVGVDVFMTPVSHTGWNTPVSSAGRLYLGTMQSSGAQNDEISFDVVLAAGTWTFELIHEQDTGIGIYTVLFNGTSIGTIDGYAAVLTTNTRSRVSGISTTSSGKLRITLRIATKNASSSGYGGRINHLKLIRTA